jgi:hypothetical protein
MFAFGFRLSSSCWVWLCSHCCCADRIEAMRREIGVTSVSGGVDQVQLEELLGEGSYGKVYKGKDMRCCPAAAAGAAGTRKVPLC